MKKLPFSLLLSLAFLSHLPLVSAQSLMSKLGAIEVDMEIRSGENIINIGPAYLVKRAAGLTHFMFESTAGIEAWHLEFKTTDPILANPIKRKALNEFYYVVSFYDQKGEQLHQTKLDRTTIKRASPQGGEAVHSQEQHFYSLNLHQFPLLLLEEVKTVDIQFFGEYR